MSFHESLMNLIHREVLRVVHRNTRRTPAVVSAYDPDTYSCKFKLMPDSVEQTVETGWVPLGTHKASIMQQSGTSGGTAPTGGGQGASPGSNQNQQPYGWHMPPEIGEQGWLEFHDDDREAATWSHSSYNDNAKPVKTQAGEWQYISPWGHVIYHKQDGSLTIKSGNQQQSQNQQTGTGSQGSSKQPAKQATIFIDNKSNVTITLTGTDGDNTMGTLTVNAPGDIVHNAKGNVTVTAGQNKTISFTAQKIVHNGLVYLGGSDATKQVAFHGTIDTHGAASVANLATKVFAK